MRMMGRIESVTMEARDLRMVLSDMGMIVRVFEVRIYFSDAYLRRVLILITASQ